MGFCRKKGFFIVACLLLLAATPSISQTDDISVDRRVFPTAALQETILRVADRGNFSIRAGSDAGTRIVLVDRMSGVLAADGRAGQRDGRIDTLL
jgi:hypothetical protein